MLKSNSVFIYDCNNYLHRYWHTQPPKFGTTGVRIESMTGTLNSIRTDVQRYKPAFSIAAFDDDRKTFRHERCPLYKAHRPETDPLLKEQIQPLKDYLDALGIPVVDQPGIEADDSIGILSKYFANLGLNVVIFSTDKDLCQLVDKNIQIFNPTTKKLIDRYGVFDKLKVYPEQVAESLAIQGDKSDNILGIDGVAQGKAGKWLLQYGNLDNLIENSHELPGKLGSRFRDSIPRIRHNHELTKILTDQSKLHAQYFERIETRMVKTDQLAKLSEIFGYKAFITPHAA